MHKYIGSWELFVQGSSRETTMNKKKKEKRGSRIRKRQ